MIKAAHRIYMNDFLKKYKFVDDEFNFINEDGHRVNRQGQLIDEDGRPFKLVGKSKKKVYLDGEKKVTFKPFLDDKGNPVELDDASE